MFSKEIKIEILNERNKNTLIEHLSIEFIEIGNDFVVAKMPVDSRTHQPYGLLHGGASLVLAETLGSVASNLLIDFPKQVALGLEINANHLKSVKSGWVYGKCSPIHIGKSTHVWDIKISDENQQLICISRLTVAIKNYKN